jgi:hypothetical protein
MSQKTRQTSKTSIIAGMDFDKAFITIFYFFNYKSNKEFKSLF